MNDTSFDITKESNPVQTVAPHQYPLREWFSKLSYRHIEVKEGQSSGDGNGNEVYTFAFTGGDWLGFSYIINEENDCYILSPEGNWFSVTNPSNPPVVRPTE